MSVVEQHGILYEDPMQGSCSIQDSVEVEPQLIDQAGFHERCRSQSQSPKHRRYVGAPNCCIYHLVDTLAN